MESGGDDFTFSTPAPAKVKLTDRATVVDLTSSSSTQQPQGVDNKVANPLPPRNKVMLEKGYSQMDWMRKMAATKQATPRKITFKEVRKHKTIDDAWMILKGKVYDITPYMRFHPGGVEYLMQAAGKDGTALFNKYHQWVNAEFLLERFLLGVLE